ncbi:hypothetical protein Gohar_014813 [Gossypium harknessii]|uniref:Uncharacterized protein n=3 Tax=Gossypium TaxID=3633 RepID=A0A7J9IGN1_9ROSI|nr:hypothetical protein [Gossypium raimondii]MBA0790147.1 hypothetical protein [Gossypium harknessii]MBA0821251.1 hypothetical protein [Gossypium armourianum]
MFRSYVKRLKFHMSMFLQKKILQQQELLRDQHAVFWC